MKYCNKCSDGWLMKDGKVVGKCRCVLETAVHTAFHKYAEADQSLFKTFDELDENPMIQNTKSNKLLEYKQFGKMIVDNFDKLSREGAKIYLFGEAESGKSQFSNSLIKELAYKEELAFYLPAHVFSDALFDYNDKTKLRRIFDKIKNPKTKLLVIDDLGSEIAKADNRLFELITKYNELIRDFQRFHPKDNGGCMLVVSSNHSPEQLTQNYNNDKRLFSVTFQEGTTRYFKFSSKSKFRQKQVSETMEIFD